MVAGLKMPAGPMQRLVRCGLAIWAVLVFFILLYVNFPPGVDQPFGIHRLSVEFFHLLWPYPALSLSPVVFQIVLMLVIVGLWTGYGLALRTVLRLPEDTDHAHLVGPIFVFAFIFNLMLLIFLPPVTSGDVFHYAIQGSINVIHGFNPYVTSPNQVADDPFLPLVLWREGTTHYGPAWIQLASLCAWLGNGSIILTVYCFKVLAMLANFLGAFLVFSLSRRFTGGDGIAPLLFYAWNPILLLESAGAAHNDAVMMCVALLGISLISRDRLFLGVALLLVSATIKYVTLLLLAFVLFYVLVRQSPLQRVQLAMRLGLLSLLIVIVLYAPFLSGLGHPAQLFKGLSPVNPMTNDVAEVIRQVIGVILTIVGLDPARYVGAATNAVFVVVLLYLASPLRDPDATLADVCGRFGLATLVYAYFIYGGSFPWYLVGPFTMLALAPPTRGMFYARLLTIGLGVGSTLQMAMLISVF